MYHLAAHSDPTTLISFLFFKHINLPPTAGLFPLFFQQTLSPDIHVYFLTFFRSLLQYRLIRDPLAYFYQDLFAYFSKLQKIPSFPIPLAILAFPSTYFHLIYIHFFMYCLSVAWKFLKDRDFCLFCSMMRPWSLQPALVHGSYSQ